MNTTSETSTLSKIHTWAVEAYRAGQRDADALVMPEHRDFLKRIGVSSQVVKDYAEDFVKHAAPDAATFIAVAEARKQFFHTTQRSIPATRIVQEPELPLREEQWDGIPWLPRIAMKARCFLEGTLCDDVMYGCGGDRRFIAEHHLSLPGFLEIVRGSEGAPEKIVAAVKASRLAGND